MLGEMYEGIILIGEVGSASTATASSISAPIDSSSSALRAASADVPSSQPGRIGAVLDDDLDILDLHLASEFSRTFIQRDLQ